MTKTRPTRLDYCQFLLVSQTNYTLTYYADHTDNRMRYDAINRYLRQDRLTSRLVWEQARTQLLPSVHGYVILVNCVYVNPETGQYWVIDYRLFDLEHYGKSKLDHVRDILTQIVKHKQLPFHAVLMDT